MYGMFDLSWVVMVTNSDVAKIGLLLTVACSKRSVSTQRWGGGEATDFLVLVKTFSVYHSYMLYTIAMETPRLVKCNLVPRVSNDIGSNVPCFGFR